MEPRQHHRASLSLSLCPPHPRATKVCTPTQMSLGASVPHTGMLRGCSFLQGPGGARPGSEWKWGHFLADAPLPPGYRARAPTRTFGQLMAKAQPPPSLCTISTVGEWKAMRGSPEAGSRVSSHIPPFAPNRVQVPYGEQLLYLSPHSMPQTRNNSNCKTRKHLLCPQHLPGHCLSLDHHNFQDGWYYHSHFTDEETGFSQQETQAGHQGR